jgi:hypothetical protein
MVLSQLEQHFGGLPTWYNRPSGENTVRYLEKKSKCQPYLRRGEKIYLSYEVLDMVLGLSKGNGTTRVRVKDCRVPGV